MSEIRFIGKENREEFKSMTFFTEHPDITHLDLSGLGLYYISDDIGKLSNLVYLDLSNNNFSKIPVTIGLCTNLKEMKLGGNPIINEEPYKTLLKDDPQGPIKFLQRICNPTPFKIHALTNTDTKTFRIYSWNVLAQNACKEHLHPFTEKRYLEREYRSRLVAQQLQKVYADIIVIQETDYIQMSTLLVPLLSTRKMAYNFTPKHRFYSVADERKQSVPGLATFVNHEVFEIKSSVGIACNQLEKCKEMVNREDLERCDDVVQFTAVKLRRRPFINLVIVNVDLFFGDEGVRTSFAEAIAHHAVEYGHKEFQNFDIVVAGDFNANPSDAPLERFRSAHLIDAYRSRPSPSSISSTSLASSVSSASNTSKTETKEVKKEMTKEMTKEVNKESVGEERLTVHTSTRWGFFDHILLSRGLVCEELLETETVGTFGENGSRVPNRTYPSNHFPVGAAIRHRNRD